MATDMVSDGHLEFTPLIPKRAYFRLYLQQVNQNWQTYTLCYMNPYERSIDMIDLAAILNFKMAYCPAYRRIFG